LRIRAGYDISFECYQDIPMLLLVSVHPSRAADLLSPGIISFSPGIPVHVYRDSFGNDCTRIVAPQGRLTLSTRFDVADSGLPDEVNWAARQHPVEQLPDDTMVYLLGSRYCETDRLSDAAWSMFGHVTPGWARVQAICDFVHRHIRFDYQQARPTRTAAEAYQEGIGVCRDYAHLAVTFCRCMNIPARYCTGYLGDIGVPPIDAPGDFSAWFEVFLEGRWYTFDARHNTPRIGRILMARGRDAVDVAISNNFGSAALAAFFVVTDEVLG
jgi:transglutaminase-like putative cysteine protease